MQTIERRKEIYTELIEILEYSKSIYEDAHTLYFTYKDHDICLSGLCGILSFNYKVNIYHKERLQEELPELYEVCPCKDGYGGYWFETHPFDHDSRIKLLEASLEILNKK